MTVSMDSTVGDLVVDRPSRSRVFAELGIDFCCGGKKTLAQVCAEKGLEPAALVERLQAQRELEPPSQWADAPLFELTRHVVDTHHVFTRNELDRLGPMISKVARVHGDKHPYMVALVSVFDAFAQELADHMMKEERVLFPAIEALESGRPGMNPAMPIRMMNGEHESCGADLARMRALTHDFTLPPGGCNTFRAVLSGLEELEADLFEHIHLESNILFPRALRLLG